MPTRYRAKQILSVVNNLNFRKEQNAINLKVIPYHKFLVSILCIIQDSFYLGNGEGSLFPENHLISITS